MAKNCAERCTRALTKTTSFRFTHLLNVHEEENAWCPWIGLPFKNTSLQMCVCVCVCVLVWLLMSTYCCLFKLLVKLHCRFDVHTLKTCWWWKNSYFFESVHIHALTNSSHITENISNFNYSIGIKAPLFCSFAQSFGSSCITARSVYVLPESRWQERKQERKQ